MFKFKILINFFNRMNKTLIFKKNKLKNLFQTKI